MKTTKTDHTITVQHTTATDSDTFNLAVALET